ncbi:MAG: phage antirepressor N-terminal domain-containing protein [Anaerolineae bacterium]|nr:phage antirepressor N-terminal domain-containing protein [Anaerolineae bacterium]
MSEEKALVVVEQREVDFYGDEIVAVLAKDGLVYVPIRPICDNLGITLAGQRERIGRDPVLSKAVSSVSVTLTQQSRAMLCLPLKFIPGWLFGINANRVKEDLRDKIIRYQEECYDVLWEAFRDGLLTAEPFAELLETDSPEVQAYMMARAIMQMARNQLLLKARVDTHSQRLDTHELRLETVEAALSNPDRLITEDQAMQLSQAVKAIGLELGKRSGRNEFGGVWGELYRQYKIAAYRQLPAAKFDQAMNFLRQWYGSLTDDDDVPF